MPHCCLCGDVVQLKANVPAIEDNPFEMWLGDFSSIYATEDHANATVSFSWRGQRLDIYDAIYVRFAADSTSFESDLEAARAVSHQFEFREIILNRDDFETPLSLDEDGDGLPEVWGFPFHSSCWDLLEQSNPEPCIDIDALFRLCRSQRVSNDGLLDWGHDYGGLIDWISTPGEGTNNWELRPGNSFDPLDIFKSVKHHLDEVELVSGNQALSTQGFEGKPDAFSSLPVEIISAFLALLPSKDVANLRLASRRIASIELPDSFWISRFRPGHEFDHIYEAKPHLVTRRGHNKLNYLAVKQARDESGITSRALDNRRRIWGLCEGMHETLRQMKDVECRGIELPSQFEPDVTPKYLDGRVWTTISDRDPSLCSVQDILYERFVTAPPNGRLTAFVSTISLFGNQYVTGLRIRDNYGYEKSFGYVRRDNERRLSPHRGIKHPVISLTAAFDAQGVRGLALSSDEGLIESDWIGDHSGLPKKVLPGVLFSDQSCLYVFRGGFDGVRLVQLSVARDIYRSSPEMLLLSNLPWWPEVPYPTLTPLLGTPGQLGMIRNDGRLLPLCFKTFGGTDGELVHRLTGLTFIMTPDPTKDNSINFRSVIMHSLKKKDKVNLGLPILKSSHDAREPDFTIDGLGGERITGTSVRAEGHTVVGFWVTMASTVGISNIGLMAAGPAADSPIIQRNIKDYVEYVRRYNADEAK